MSRRSSFGYSSYSSRSYRSGGYNGRRGRKSKKNKWLLLILIVLLAAATAVALLYFFVLQKNNDSQSKPSAESAVSDAGQSTVPEASASQTSAEPSAQQSSTEVSEDPAIEGYFDGNVFVYDKQGYKYFQGTDETAVNYAGVVSSIKKSLGKDIRVYNLVAPSHAAFALPERYRAQMNDEKANIEKIYSSYTEDVIPINVFEAEEKHKNEYTYFKTDSNWTGLGAYYAYQEFCKALKINGISLSSLSKGNITGYKGSYCTDTKSDKQPNGNKELASNPDTVIYYNMPNIESCVLLENGTSQEKEVPLIATFASPQYAYNAFIWGPNPYMKIKTSQKTGRKLCIIADSYGCAFTPFVTANFDEIYYIDPDYYEGNVLEYIKKHKFTDVLVINSIMYANYVPKVNNIKTVLK